MNADMQLEGYEREEGEVIEHDHVQTVIKPLTVPELRLTEVIQGPNDDAEEDGRDSKRARRA